MKTGVIVEGGGMRGIYSAGVIDKFLEYGLHFDYCVGASAGGANLMTYQAKQYKRNYRFYHEWSKDPRFLSFSSWMKTGQYFGLDYIYDDLASTHGVDPLDYNTILADPAGLEVVATDCNTGMPAYFSKEMGSLNHYDIIKASCTIPIVCHPVVINGVPYVDGGVADPLPLKRAIEEKHCDFLVIVLVHHWPHDILERRNTAFYRFGLRKYPKLHDAVMACDDLHMEEVEEAFSLVRHGKALIIMPASEGEVSTGTKDPELLDELYMEGYNDTEKVKDILLEKAKTDKKIMA